MTIIILLYVVFIHLQMLDQRCACSSASAGKQPSTCDSRPHLWLGCSAAIALVEPSRLEGMGHNFLLLEYALGEVKVRWLMWLLGDVLCGCCRRGDTNSRSS